MTSQRCSQPPRLSAVFPSDLSAASLQYHSGLEMKHASLPSPGASRDEAQAQCADHRDLFPPVTRAGEHCPAWSDLEEDTHEVWSIGNRRQTHKQVRGRRYILSSPVLCLRPTLPRPHLFQEAGPLGGADQPADGLWWGSCLPHASCGTSVYRRAWGCFSGRVPWRSSSVTEDPGESGRCERDRPRAGPRPECLSELTAVLSLRRWTAPSVLAAPPKASSPEAPRAGPPAPCLLP